MRAPSLAHDALAVGKGAVLASVPVGEWSGLDAGVRHGSASIRCDDLDAVCVGQVLVATVVDAEAALAGVDVGQGPRGSRGLRYWPVRVPG